MASAYKIVEFLNETKDSDILELASLLSDNRELVKSDNNKLVVMRYDVEKYITNIDTILARLGTEYTFPIMTNYKFVDIFKNLELLDIKLLNANFGFEKDELNEDKSEELNKYLSDNNITELWDVIINENIKIKQIEFKISRSSVIRLSSGGIIYASHDDLVQYKMHFINLANFIIFGDVYEKNT